MTCADRVESEDGFFCELTGNRCDDEDIKACEEYVMATRNMKFQPLMHV